LKLNIHDPVRRYLYLRLSAATLAVLLLALALYLVLLSDERERVAQARESVIAARLSRDMSAKATQLENTFNAMYQNARTISLLPSVRAIEGSNRLNEKEDVVAQGRFSSDGYKTVQQLYNNLAGSAHVSEVYAVLQGLEYKKGQVPFFMFDTLIVDSNAKADEGAGGAKNPDYPEELEDFEYTYFPKQLALIKEKYPSFNFTRLDDVPAYLSPVMRTCDNTQYYSLKACNVLDSNGFLYSVPFYHGTKKTLTGVISVISRTNAYEAELLDIPFLILTAKDRVAAQQAGFSMPQQLSPFALVNDAYGIRIYDRRNAEMRRMLKNPGAFTERLYTRALKIHSDSPWTLYYDLSPAVLASELAPLNSSFIGRAWVAAGFLLLFYGFLLFFFFRQYRAYRELLDLRAVERTILQAADSCDFTLRVASSGSSKAEHTIQALNRLFDMLQSSLRDVSVTLGQVMTASGDMRQSSAAMAQSALHGSVAAQHMHRELEAIAQSVSTLAERTQQASALTRHSYEIAEGNDAVIHQTVEEIRTIASSVTLASERITELQHSTDAISRVVGVIDELAKQTNLLALNAAIEAARAGEQGRGFAVVADEVRKLADRTTQSTREIDTIIGEILANSRVVAVTMKDVVSRVESGVEHVAQAGTAVAQIKESSAEVLAVVGAISQGIAEQNSHSGEVADEVASIASDAAQTERIATQTVQDANRVGELAANMKQNVARFKVGD